MSGPSYKGLKIKLMQLHTFDVMLFSLMLATPSPKMYVPCNFDCVTELHLYYYYPLAFKVRHACSIKHFPYKFASLILILS